MKNKIILGVFSLISIVWITGIIFACISYPSINIVNQCTVSFDFNDSVNPDAISWILEQNKINCSISSEDISTIMDFFLKGITFVEKQNSQEYTLFLEEVTKQNAKKECTWYYQNFSNNNGWTGYLTFDRQENGSGDNCLISAPSSCEIPPSLIFHSLVPVCGNGKCEGETEKADCLQDCRKGKAKILPAVASQRAKERLGELGFNITLKEIGNNKTIYEASGEKNGKFLGLFKVKGKVFVEVDSETGDVVKVHKPWWSFLAGI